MTETVLPDGASLGTALRSAREQAGLAVEEVSTRTRIRGTVLRDLEADRFASSGGSVYARGHVKSICSALRIPPEPYLELFTRQVDDEAAAPPVVAAVPEPRRAPSKPLPVPKADRPERRGPNWPVAGIAALGVLVVLFAIGQISQPHGSGADPADAGATVAPPAVAGPTKAPPLTAQRPAATGADLRLRLVGGASWVSVRTGAKTLFEGVLPVGAVRDFRDAQQLRLIVGNAGAVNLVCGGKDLGPAGGAGKVKRFTCDASGIVAG